MFNYNGLLTEKKLRMYTVFRSWLPLEVKNRYQFTFFLNRLHLPRFFNQSVTIGLFFLTISFFSPQKKKKKKKIQEEGGRQAGRALPKKQMSGIISFACTTLNGKYNLRLIKMPYHFYKWPYSSCHLYKYNITSLFISCILFLLLLFSSLSIAY